MKYLTNFYVDYVLRHDRLEKLEKWANEKQKKVPYNTDFRPVSYLYGLRLWFSFFGEKLFSKIDMYSAANTIFVSMIFLYLLMVLLFVKIKKMINELVVVVVSGASIILALAIIFAFQSVYGYVYQKIGILLSLNLLGISVGSFLSEKYFRGKYNNIVAIKLSIIFMAVFSLILTVMSKNQLFVSAYLFYLFVLTAGFFIGFIFPVAVTENRIGKFYALDLLGAIIGSALVSLIFIPLFGITVTCFFVAVCLFLLIFLIFFVK